MHSTIYADWRGSRSMHSTTMHIYMVSGTCTASSMYIYVVPGACTAPYYLGTVKCVHLHTCAFSLFSSFKFCAFELTSTSPGAKQSWPHSGGHKWFINCVQTPSRNKQRVHTGWLLYIHTHIHTHTYTHTHTCTHVGSSIIASHTYTQAHYGDALVIRNECSIILIISL